MSIWKDVSDNSTSILIVCFRVVIIDKNISKGRYFKTQDVVNDKWLTVKVVCKFIWSYRAFHTKIKVSIPHTADVGVNGDSVLPINRNDARRSCKRASCVLEHLTRAEWTDCFNIGRGVVCKQFIKSVWVENLTSLLFLHAKIVPACNWCQRILTVRFRINKVYYKVICDLLGQYYFTASRSRFIWNRSLIYAPDTQFIRP